MTKSTLYNILLCVAIAYMQINVLNAACLTRVARTMSQARSPYVTKVGPVKMALTYPRVPLFQNRLRSSHNFSFKSMEKPVDSQLQKVKTRNHNHNKQSHRIKNTGEAGFLVFGALAYLAYSARGIYSYFNPDIHDCIDQNNY